MSLNLSELKSKVLIYIDEYSVDGVKTSDGENADYLLKINSMANDCQKEIANKIGIEASVVFDLSTYSSDTTYLKIDLPTDFKELMFVNLDDEPFFDFRIQNSKLIIDKTYTGSLEVFYDKYPTFIDENTADTYEFEIDQHAQSLIPLYVGGMVISNENAAQSDKLLNIYYSDLSGLKKKSHDYVSEIKVM